MRTSDGKNKESAYQLCTNVSGKARCLRTGDGKNNESAYQLCTNVSGKARCLRTGDGKNKESAYQLCTNVSGKTAPPCSEFHFTHRSTKLFRCNDFDALRFSRHICSDVSKLSLPP